MNRSADRMDKKLLELWSEAKIDFAKYLAEQGFIRQSHQIDLILEQFWLIKRDELPRIGDIIIYKQGDLILSSSIYDQLVLDSVLKLAKTHPIEIIMRGNKRTVYDDQMDERYQPIQD